MNILNSGNKNILIIAILISGIGAGILGYWQYKNNINSLPVISPAVSASPVITISPVISSNPTPTPTYYSLKETYTVKVCTHNKSENCYNLNADVLSGIIESVYFPSGERVVINAKLDKDGKSEIYVEGENWTITCSKCVTN